MSTRSGFTLLEILVALAIVVTAWAGIAAALPRLIGPSPAERAALAVEGVLRQAREAAHEGRSPVTVRLQDGGRTVAAPSLGARADLPSDIVARLEGVRGWGGNGHDGAFAVSDEAAIVFLPDGSSSGGCMTPR
jgi:prepilin-type N-terminal cleavage/methylation domain-containing protein